MSIPDSDISSDQYRSRVCKHGQRPCEPIVIIMEVVIQAERDHTMQNKKSMFAYTFFFCVFIHPDLAESPAKNVTTGLVPTEASQ